MITSYKMSLFSRPPLRTSLNKKSLPSRITAHCSQDCIIVYRSELDNFLKRENHAYPPSLSLYGKLGFVKKSDLLEYLENLCKTCVEAPSVSVIILDGAAAVVIMLILETHWYEDIPRKCNILLHLRNVHKIVIIFLCMPGK